MAVTNPGANLSLRISRTLQHSREKVFEAWTDPKVVARWFAPSDGFRVVVRTLEPRVGGRYAIEMHHPDGGVHTAIGTYRAVERPSKLAFTWSWENDPSRGEETLVTVELLEHGSHTELVLTHERFASEELRERHNQGWVGCLNRLDPVL